MKHPSTPNLYTWAVKVGEKGQFVIPKEARDLFDIHPGDTLLLFGDAERGIAIPPKKALSEMHRSVFDQKGADET